jgi:hypothetical protein
MGEKIADALDHAKEVLGVIGDQARDKLGPVGDVIHQVISGTEYGIKVLKQIDEALVPAISGGDPKAAQFTSFKEGVYIPASTQDVNVGYQNYLTALLKIAPQYVGRYGTDVLRERYVNTITLREQQAATDQPKIHQQRNPLLRVQEARLRNAEKLETAR